MTSTTTTPAWTRAVTPTTPDNEAASPPSSVEEPSNPSPVTPESTSIAIIGMGCRVPGGSDSPEELWDYLMNKGDACGDMPAFRWEPYHDRNPKNPVVLAKTTSKGYFLDRLQDFDAAFFSISPREAEQMDPQQRITLEVAWKALENAGIPPQSLAGSNTGVYMGVNSDDYAKLVLEDLENVGAHMGVGTAYCGIPSRVSYILDLMGPSIAIDAACASSLVAVHHARQAILAGETDLAIAGGVNALIGPGLTRVLDEAGAIAADGRCRSFDDSAHGYGRGEGAGVVIMKRLDKALADGDHVLSVLKGSAVCADGKTAGIMAPNAVAQELVAVKALKEAKVPASSISYIEAHATSTPLGDPTETAGLARIYGHGARKSTCPRVPIGSIKSNIGHLEAGAGVMSLIKAVMVMQKQLVPPQANFEVPSTKIDWASNMLLVCKEPTKLESSNTPSRAAIASYGYSGTVSHAIIEAAPRGTITHSNGGSSSTPYSLLLSAPQAARIPAAAKSLVDWLELNKNVSLKDLSNTLASRRGHHRFRSSVVASDVESAIVGLRNLAAGADSKLVASGRISNEAEKGQVWVFSGHGAQWSNMGKELYSTRPEFREVVQSLEPIISEQLGFSAIQALQDGNIERTDAVQALTFLMHIGIAKVMMAETGPPSAIVGHSLGEVAAAVVAGAITLREGAMIVCSRARLYRQVMGKGAMAMVSLPFEETAQKLAGRQRVSVAIDASPSSSVISGDADVVEELSVQWLAEGIQVRKVKSDVAFHSESLIPLAEPMRKDLQSTIRPKSPAIPLYSTSTKDSKSNVSRDIDYWIDNMIQPVLLRNTVNRIAEDGYRAFVEISSHPIVTHSIEETLGESNVEGYITLPTMLRNKPAQENIIHTVGRLYCFGTAIRYTQRSNQPWLSGVPGVTWSHQPFWRQVAKVPFASSLSHDPLSNTLLGQSTPLWGTDTVLYQTRLDESNKPFPGNHPLHGSEIVPAAVLINTFLHAVDGKALQDFSLKVPVVVAPARDVQIRVEPKTIEITSRLAPTDSKATNDGAWLSNTSSSISDEIEGMTITSIDLDELKKSMTKKLPSTFSTDYLAKVGVPEMGFPWKVLGQAEGEDSMLARVSANPENAPGCNDNWTSILDSATSIASTIFYKEPLLRMPTAISKVIKAPSASAPDIGYIYCKKVPGSVATDILITDDAGTVLIEIQAMAFAGIEGEASARESTNGLVHRVAWVPARYSEEATNIKHIAFLPEVLDARLSSFHKQVSAKGITTSVLEDVSTIATLDPGSIIIHIPDDKVRSGGMLDASCKTSMKLVAAVQTAVETAPTVKVFSLLDSSDENALLRNGTLHGLARILKSEQPQAFGSLIEVEDGIFPLAAMKYIQEEPIIRMEDGVPRVSRLREFAEPKPTSTSSRAKSMFRPEGTYLITGGLGALGLEVAAWMVEQGARRLLLVSRSRLPKRSTWTQIEGTDNRIQRIRQLEKLGATVNVLSVDMSADNGSELLSDAIDALSLPSVTGIVHAAGVLEDQLVEEITAPAFKNVLAPKITGAMHLHNLFPAGSLDFFVLFSSCGQLLGFPGQASYASGNAFLDALAAHRRQQGDKATAIQWTSWRGMGMAASTDYINAELNARGITDVSRNEAFLAWGKIAALETDHAVVLRTLPLEADDLLPHPILSDIIVRKIPVAVSADGAASGVSAPASQARPTGGPELEQWLRKTITGCVASTLSAEEDVVDPHLALAEMGMDSVMTLLFRTKLQNALKIRTKPTLLWKCPTVDHLVKHFVVELGTN